MSQPRPQTLREAWSQFGSAWSDLWDDLSGTTPGYHIRMLAERLGYTPQTVKERMMPRSLPQHVRFLKDGTGRPCVAIEYEDYLGGYRYAVVVLSEKDTPTKAGAHRRLRSRMQASRQQKDGKLFVAFKPWNGRPDKVNKVMVLVKTVGLLRIGWTAKAGFLARVDAVAKAVVLGDEVRQMLRVAPWRGREVHPMGNSTSVASGGSLAPNEDGLE